MNWTEDRIEQLKSLWTEGQSASAIATTLGEVSRNAVIGKVHRLGLAGRPKTSTPHPSRRRSTPTRRRRTVRSSGRLPTALRKNVYFRLLELGPAPQIPVTIATLTAGTCHWPEGNPKAPGFHFCGRPTSSPLGPYCKIHMLIACQKRGPAQTDGTSMVTPPFDERRERRAAVNAD
jgi:GcrA cell cycle regulator